MKWTKLSLVAALAVSSAVAGGDIAPVEPVVEAPVVEAAACNSNTTINSKAVLYSFTTDGYGDLDWYKGDSSALGAAVTLDVAHKITDNVTANVTAVGFTNLTNSYDKPDVWGQFEGQETGAFLNIANITAAYGDTTFVLGRQLLDTPMIQSFDWLLAPGSFEAYTVVNKSISNLTLVGSYIAEYRMNGSGTDFAALDGDNWTVGASYSDTFDASVWYYNVDAALYTQVYADLGYDFGSFKVAGQYVDTDWDLTDSSTAYGVKAETALAGFDLTAAYVKVDDNPAGFVDWDGLYTSMWMTPTSISVGDNFMVSAATEFSGIAVSVAYGDFEYENIGTEGGSEFDLVLGYGFTDCISLDAAYTITDYGTGDDEQVMELIATYKF
ncbi:hypothetical protein MN086_03055 [Sulfurovum sp. XGS-02]|uniref:hypothetical protein n=1 Tax=Sulfurovum sp. XGS-02 TaxID=2925411 RepID=UPI00205C4B4D|nr:hypothetical protein [Sulfurovum sp. XGS-02]UPT78132.1 hypothetical protein MN086_03055 [Sulfurovum sp. XGS-02]